MTSLFYDGGCGLCQAAVRFTARQDRSGRVRFAPLGGETFKRRVPLASRVNLPDSLVVLTADGQLLTRSAAVIHLLRQMGPQWQRVGVMLAWLPEPLSDAAYRLVACLRPRERTCPLDASTQDDRFDP